MLCFNCLRNIDDKLSECNNCNNNTFLNKEGKKYIFNGQVFTTTEWLLYLSPINVFSNNRIILNNNLNKINSKYLKEMFILNAKKFTFLRLKLLCYVFLAASLMILPINVILQNRGNINIDDNKNQFIFLYFIVFLFLTFGLIFLFRIIKKNKIFISKHRNRIKYNYITYLEYNKILDLYDKICEEKL